MTRILTDFGSEILLLIQIAIVFLFIRERRRFLNESEARANFFYRTFQAGYEAIDRRMAKREKQIAGLADRATLKAKTAEVLADRAFNMASSSNLAVMSLQKALTVRPTYISKKKQLENEVAQRDVMKVIGGTPDYSGFDWLRPILGPDEIDLIDKALDHAEKFKNGDKES